MLQTTGKQNSSLFSVAHLTFDMLVSKLSGGNATTTGNNKDLVINYSRQTIMKKTLLAVTIPALFAVSANAATVYEKDGQKFDVYGRAQANIADKEAARLSGFDNTAEKTTLIGTGRIGLKGTTAINSQVSAFARGEWHVNAEQSSANNDEIGRAHV